MSIVLLGSTSGSITLQEPAIAGTTTLDLPASSGNVVVDAATQTLTNKTLGSGLVMGASAVTRETAVATTSGTAVDFTNIPSWVRRITVMFNGLSTTGTNRVLVQLGDSGGIETTGYFGAVTTIDNASALTVDFQTTGIPIRVGNQANSTSGVITLVNIDGNAWIATGTQATDATTDYIGYISCTKTLSDVLTQVRITRTSSDTFDAGTINILYE